MVCFSQCRQCDTPYDPDVVYATFLTDFAERVGWRFDGRRPRWVRQFCSEGCRNVDIVARRRIQNDNTARRRAAEKAADRSAQ